MRTNNIIPLNAPLKISTIQHVRKSKLENKVAVPVKTGRMILKMDQIMYIRAQSNYAELVDIEGNQYLLTNTLKIIEGYLPSKSFFRCHQSYLVNVNFICEIYENRELILKSGTRIKNVPMSRRKAVHLKGLFLFV